MKILVVTRDLVGPVRNGGIGTACTSLVEEMKQEGHEVSILYALGEYSADNNFAYWKRYYSKKLGADLISLPMIGGIEAPPIQAVSYMIYRWLVNNAKDYDIVYSPEWRGLMFYPLTGRAQGLIPQELKVIIGTHSPSLWVYDGNNRYPDGYDPLYADFMEKTVVELADEVVHPSQHMKDWIKDTWDVDKGVVIQNFMPYNTRERVVPHGKEALKPLYTDSIDEIIFFGRFTAKKGVDVFCNAIDILDPERKIAITFLGVDDTLYGVPSSNYIRKKAKNWDNITLNLIMDKDQKQAVKYLATKKDALIVVGSVFENLPYTVMEAIGLGKPIIVPEDSGGTLELFANPDEFTYKRTPKGLAEKLQELLESNKIAVPGIAVPQWKVKQQWLDIFESVNMAPIRNTTTEQPLVSVCMAHYNRPEMIKIALESLNNQTYPRDQIEIVVCDDRSTDENYAVLEQYYEDGLINNLIRNDVNSYLGFTRNQAINASKGEYILIMDDDNVAKPRELEVLVKAAILARTDALTVTMDKFAGALNPEYGEHKGLGLFLGGSVINGLYKNVFGDANGLYKAETIKKYMYTEVQGVGFEDWELLATLALNDHKVWSCPESLFYYRLHPDNKDSMLMSGNGYKDMTRMLRIYQKFMSKAHPDLGRLLPAYVHGMQKAVFDMSRDVHWLQEMIQKGQGK